MPQLRKNSGFEIIFHSANKSTLSLKYKRSSEKKYHDDSAIQRTISKYRFQIEKKFVDLRPRTVIYLSKSGKSALMRYIEDFSKIIDSSLD